MASRDASRWPALLMSRPFSGLYDDGHLHDAKQITGFFPDTTFLGDIRSFNWDGGSDLTTADTVATEGVLIDMSLGSSQWMGDFFIGGDFVLISGGSIKTDTTGTRIEFTSANKGTAAFYSGDGAETASGNILSYASGSVLRLRLDSPAATSDLPTKIELRNDGLVEVEGKLTFRSADSDTYIDGDAADQLNFHAGGVEMLRLTEDTDDQVFLGNFGSTTVPSLSRIDDPDSGFSLTGSDAGSIVMGGVEMVNFTESTADVVNVGPSSEVDLQVGGSSVPRGVLGYAQVTADQGSITSEVDLTSLTVTVTVDASRRIRISGHVLLQSDVASDTAFLRIAEGAANLSYAATGNSIGAAAANQQTTHAEVILTPSSGSHTYKLRAGRYTGTGTVTMKAASTVPAFIICEDIGAA